VRSLAGRPQGEPGVPRPHGGLGTPGVPSAFPRRPHTHLPQARLLGTQGAARPLLREYLDCPASVFMLDERTGVGLRHWIERSPPHHRRFFDGPWHVTVVCGVDGSRTGWVAVMHDLAAGHVTWKGFPSLSSLVQERLDAAIIAIDVPIGLP